MHRRVCRELVTLGLILFTAACTSDNTTPAPTPTPTTAAAITETFSGPLNPNGAHTHPFAVPNAGTVTATLQSLTPDTTLVVGLALGTWNGTSCQIILAADGAKQNTSITGNVSSAGNLCVRVYDVGNLVGPESYQVIVTHP